MAIDNWFLENLVCPRDKGALTFCAGKLTCGQGHEYPVVADTPIMLVDDAIQTHHGALSTLKMGRDDNREGIHFTVEPSDDGIDAFVQNAVAGTSGYFYKNLIGKLKAYPIPALDLRSGEGRSFLDLGCNWGRWCIAAGRLGYQPVGIDPQLEPILAARRVAGQLGIKARYVVADARFLPFREHSFDAVYSYSVLQHLSKSNVATVLREVRRVMKLTGQSRIQMMNAFGLRSIYHQCRRGFREARDFEVRYWTPRELQRVFSEMIGPSDMEVAGFITQAQSADSEQFSAYQRFFLNVSEGLALASDKVPFLKNFSDNLFLISTPGR